MKFPKGGQRGTTPLNGEIRENHINRPGCKRQGFRISTHTGSRKPLTGTAKHALGNIQGDNAGSGIQTFQSPGEMSGTRPDIEKEAITRPCRKVLNQVLPHRSLQNGYAVVGQSGRSKRMGYPTLIGGAIQNR
jgi:hypothetical protein